MSETGVSIYLEESKNMLCKVFTGFKSNERLCWYASVGVPKAISFYLQRKMYDERTDKVSIDIPGRKGTLFTFSLIANKRGDSMGFAPEFKLGDEGENILNKDNPADEFDEDYFEEMGLKLSKNSEFIDCLINAFKCFVCTDGDWVKSYESKNMEQAKGIAFDGNNEANGFSDYTVCAAIVLSSIFVVLGKYRDPVNITEVDVDSLGIFKLTPRKDGYDLTVVFDKEFKSNTKCDSLAEKMAGGN